MAIDVMSETLLDLRAACKLPPLRNPRTGKAAHVASVYRYVQSGGRASDGTRVRLETVRTPRGLMTSREAVERWIARLTDPDADTDTPTPNERARQIAAAKSRLAAVGI